MAIDAVERNSLVGVRKRKRPALATLQSHRVGQAQRVLVGRRGSRAVGVDVSLAPWAAGPSRATRLRLKRSSWPRDRLGPKAAALRLAMRGPETPAGSWMEKAPHHTDGSAHRDHEHCSDRERGEDLGAHHEHARHRDHHGQPGDQYRPPGSRRGYSKCVGRSPPSCALLPFTAQVEQ